MQIPQLTYSDMAASALAGQVADTGPKDATSGQAEIALDCGLFLSKGAALNGLILPAQATDVSAHLKGVSIYSDIKEPQGYPVDLANRFAIKDTVPVLKKGRIWVVVSGADCPDDSIPYIVWNVANLHGTIRGTADGTATIAPNGVKVIQGAAIGGIALVEVNLPG